MNCSKWLWGVKLEKEPGLRIPNMLDAAVDGTFKGIYIQGEDILQSDPDTNHVAAGLAAMECVIVQDFSSTKLPTMPISSSRLHVPGKERHLHQCRTPHPARPQGDAPRNGYEDREITVLLAKAMGFDMHYDHPSQIMDEIARLTPTFAGVSFEKLENWFGAVALQRKGPEGTPVMHMNGFVRGKGKFIVTEYIATDEKTGPRFPLLLTTGRILSQYNVGAQTRRTANDLWHEEDRLEIHPHDADSAALETATG